MAIIATSNAAPANSGELEHVTVRVGKERSHWGETGSLLASPFFPADAPTPVLSVAELAQQQPSVAYAGQGGLFQTLSIRGLSGQQVANFWSNLPVLSDRRAGTASSFIDPLMIDSIEVLRGPSSVYYGNGGGAGVLQLIPRRPTGAEWQLQWASNGDENLQYLGVGDEVLSLAISRRSADDATSAGGDRLHSRFDQYNIQAVADFEVGDRILSIQQLISEGRDIGKSNNRFPDEVTDYPEERHWLGQLALEVTENTEGSVYYHYQELDTRVERPGSSINEVNSESLDFGFRLLHERAESPAGLRAGVEYFGRRGVESRERREQPAGGEVTTRQTLDAEQDGIDLFADGLKQLGPFELSAGLRWAWLEQRNRGANDTDDDAWSGFARAAWLPDDNWLFSVELATGTRFAGVSERYFSGTTGRGQVLGNPGLDPEETLGLDLGLQWQGDKAAFEAHLFGMRIDDYIERVNISDELRSFRNLTEGEITGAEFAANMRPLDTLRLEFGGHYIEAEDDDGSPLADAIAPSAFAALNYAREPWTARLRFEYRFSENDVAPGEQPLDDAQMLQCSLERTWSSGLSLRIWGRNLMDDAFTLSSDNLATEAPERSVGVTLAWRAPDR
jgi:iron complex outermembrane receptor protein